MSYCGNILAYEYEKELNSEDNELDEDYFDEMEADQKRIDKYFES